MRLTVVNASPRGSASNTRRVLEPFLEGFLSVPGNAASTTYIDEVDAPERARELFRSAQTLLLAFPLYAYALPPAAARFVWALEALKGERHPTRLAFLCQFGFREACHARALERQLARMCSELEVENLGMVVRGGCEGLDYRPRRVNERLFSGFRALGRALARNGRWSREELARFAAPEHAGSGLLGPLTSRLTIAVGNRFFWRAKLEENGALERHWDRPLLED